MISIRNLSYWYPDAPQATLQDINLEIKAGELVLVTGRSGCGKSTFLHCLKGLVPELYGGKLQGSIEVNGRPVAQLSVADLAPHVGLVMQDPETQLCNLYVRDEVAFGVENLLVPAQECSERVKRALEDVELAHLADWQVYQLSGGQKQRVAIASVLAMDPPILLLDEPTANLDSKAGREILQLVIQLKQSGRTILLVQHELDEITGQADKLLIFEGGQVAAFGSPQDILEHYGEQLTSKFGIGLPQVAATALHLKNVIQFEHLPLSRHEFVSVVPPLVSHLPAPETISPSLPHLSGQSSLIEVKGVSYTYAGTTQPAVQDLSFSIQAGEVVAIVGKNGSGKSTLARLLVGLLKPTAGNIYLSGQNLRHLSQYDIHRSTGYVFQYPESQFLADTVTKEIAYGLEVQQHPKAKISKIVSETLQLLGLEHLAEAHPFNLSGGEKRRLSVATMMVLEPRLLILDEPTYGLDEGNLVNLIDFLFTRLREQGITIVFITHNMTLVAEQAQRVLVMSEGRLAFAGPPAAFFKDVDLLSTVEIIPPPVVELAAQLREQGWSINPKAVTVGQLVDQLRTHINLAMAGS
jgi:energy-coupling factor transport system ATP-binding protein